MEGAAGSAAEAAAWARGLSLAAGAVVSAMQWTGSLLLAGVASRVRGGLAGTVTVGCAGVGLNGVEGVKVTLGSADPGGPRHVVRIGRVSCVGVRRPEGGDGPPMALHVVCDGVAVTREESDGGDAEAEDRMEGAAMEVVRAGGLSAEEVREAEEALAGLTRALAEAVAAGAAGAAGGGEAAAEETAWGQRIGGAARAAWGRARGALVRFACAFMEVRLSGGVVLCGVTLDSARVRGEVLDGAGEEGSMPRAVAVAVEAPGCSFRDAGRGVSAEMADVRVRVALSLEGEDGEAGPRVPSVEVDATELKVRLVETACAEGGAAGETMGTHQGGWGGGDFSEVGRLRMAVGGTATVEVVAADGGTAALVVEEIDWEAGRALKCVRSASCGRVSLSVAGDRTPMGTLEGVSLSGVEGETPSVDATVRAPELRVAASRVAALVSVGHAVKHVVAGWFLKGGGGGKSREGSGEEMALRAGIEGARVVLCDGSGAEIGWNALLPRAELASLNLWGLIGGGFQDTGLQAWDAQVCVALGDGNAPCALLADVKHLSSPSLASQPLALQGVRMALDDGHGLETFLEGGDLKITLPALGAFSNPPHRICQCYEVVLAGGADEGSTTVRLPHRSNRLSAYLKRARAVLSDFTGAASPGEFRAGLVCEGRIIIALPESDGPEGADILSMALQSFRVNFASNIPEDSQASTLEVKCKDASVIASGVPLLTAKYFSLQLTSQPSPGGGAPRLDGMVDLSNVEVTHRTGNALALMRLTAWMADVMAGAAGDEVNSDMVWWDRLRAAVGPDSCLKGLIVKSALRVEEEGEGNESALQVDVQRCSFKINLFTLGGAVQATEIRLSRQESSKPHFVFARIPSCLALAQMAWTAAAGDPRRAEAVVATLAVDLSTPDVPQEPKETTAPPPPAADEDDMLAVLTNGRYRLHSDSRPAASSSTSPAEAAQTAPKLERARTMQGSLLGLELSITPALLTWLYRLASSLRTQWAAGEPSAAELASSVIFKVRSRTFVGLNVWYGEQSERTMSLRIQSGQGSLGKDGNVTLKLGEMEVLYSRRTDLRGAQPCLENMRDKVRGHMVIRSPSVRASRKVQDGELQPWDVSVSRLQMLWSLPVRNSLLLLLTELQEALRADHPSSLAGGGAMGESAAAGVACTGDGDGAERIPQQASEEEPMDLLSQLLKENNRGGNDNGEEAQNEKLAAEEDWDGSRALNDVLKMIELGRPMVQLSIDQMQVNFCTARGQVLLHAERGSMHVRRRLLQQVPPPENGEERIGWDLVFSFDEASIFNAPSQIDVQAGVLWLPRTAEESTLLRKAVSPCRASVVLRVLAEGAATVGARDGVPQQSAPLEMHVYAPLLDLHMSSSQYRLLVDAIENNILVPLPAGILGANAGNLSREQMGLRRTEFHLSFGFERAEWDLRTDNASVQARCHAVLDALKGNFERLSDNSTLLTVDLGSLTVYDGPMGASRGAQMQTSARGKAIVQPLRLPPAEMPPTWSGGSRMIHFFARTAEECLSPIAAQIRRPTNLRYSHTELSLHPWALALTDDYALFLVDYFLDSPAEPLGSGGVNSPKSKGGTHGASSGRGFQERKKAMLGGESLTRNNARLLPEDTAGAGRPGHGHPPTAQAQGGTGDNPGDGTSAPHTPSLERTSTVLQHEVHGLLWEAEDDPTYQTEVPTIIFDRVLLNGTVVRLDYKGDALSVADLRVSLNPSTFGPHRGTWASLWILIKEDLMWEIAKQAPKSFTKAKLKELLSRDGTSSPRAIAPADLAFHGLASQPSGAVPAASSRSLSRSAGQAKQAPEDDEKVAMLFGRH